MLPHPHPILSNIAPCIRMRQKAAFLILTATRKEPKPKNQTGKQQTHGMRNFKRPYPHKENKTHTEKILNQPELSHEASHTSKTKIIGENRLKRVVSSIDKKITEKLAI